MVCMCIIRLTNLMAILAIESQRNQCLIIGEDLGTVPDEVRWKLNEFRIFSYFVLYFAQRNKMYPLKQDYPQYAFALLVRTMCRHYKASGIAVI